MARPGERWSETLMRRAEEVTLVPRIREEQQRLGVAESDWVGNEKMEVSDFKELNLDVDHFMKDIESILGSQGRQEQADDDSDGAEGSSMDMDFDNFEDDIEGEESNEDDKETFMESYSGAMNDELKNSTLEKSFQHDGVSGELCN